MNKKLSSTHSGVHVSNVNNLAEIQDQVFSLKKSLKIVAQSLKSEIDSIKSEIKQNHENLLKKVESILIGNKQAEDTVYQYNSVIASTTNKALENIESLKKSQSALFKEIQALKNENFQIFKYQESNHFLGTSEETEPLYKIESYRKNFDKVFKELSDLKNKYFTITEKFRDFELENIIEKNPDSKNSKKHENMTQKDHDYDVIKRIEGVEEFVSIQRKELLSSITILDQKLKKHEDSMKKALNLLSNN